MNIVITAADQLQYFDKTYRCVIGRGGFTRDKHEGDGATPIGRFPLRSLRYRSDRVQKPLTDLPLQEIRPQDGWCDDPGDPLYNRPVSRPFTASHEQLWREDRLYNLIVDLGYNDDPPVPARGSAIFLHVASNHWKPTQGCVAMDQDDLLEILKNCGPDTFIDINPR